MKTFLREFLIEIILIVVLVTAWFTIIRTYEVFQTSMEPNFHEGERVIVFKAAYWGWVGQPQRGDVIVLKAPTDSREDFIKRIIALPGDTLEIVRGTVYINGEKISEPYVKNSFTYSYPKTTIPDGEYFVLGDNRDVSNDSHRWGPLPRANIIGKVFVIYWPPGNWGLVPKYTLISAAN
jgi:signal peptidase I